MKKLSDLEQKIAALPSNPKKVRQWKVEEDAMIIKYAEEKGSEAMGKIMGVPGQAIRRRFLYLKGRMKQ